MTVENTRRLHTANFLADELNLNTWGSRVTLLTPLAVGGEHAVLRFSSPRYNTPALIFKVSMQGIQDSTPMPLTPLGEGDELLYERRLAFEREIARRQERFLRLQYHFGEHVLPERSFARAMVLTGDEYKEIAPKSDVDLEGLYFVDTFVRLQEPVLELYPDTPNHLRRRTARLDLPYAERRLLEMQHYSAANMRWVMLQSQKAPFSEEEGEILAQVQQSESLNHMIRVTRGQADPLLRVTLKDFVSRCIAYSNDTRESLDLNGENNVVFLRNGMWDYKLVDALYPKNIPIIDATAYTLRKVASGQELSEQESKNLLNGLGYVRNINALAHALGLPKRIQLFDNYDALPLWVWPKVFTILEPFVREERESY